MPNSLIIGSRGSDLALWQAHHVKGLLLDNGYNASIKIIKTQGDKIQHLSFDKLEGKGFFTKEIEEELLNGSIDIAVHSHKDLETTPPDTLVIGAVSDRENPSELLIIRKQAVDNKERFSLKKNANVGTSSARRKSQLLSFRNDITITDLRGNVPTRINKLREEQYDAIVLAAAGVTRLNIDLSEFHVEELDPRKFIPAPAQGVLGLQARKDDSTTLKVLENLNITEVEEIISIERKVLNLFEGGCQLPLGVYCKKENGVFKAWSSMAQSADHPLKRIYMEKDTADGFAEKITQQLKHQQKQSIFITRDVKSSDFFSSLLDQNGYKLHSSSLIQFEKAAIDSAKIPETDWIFFSSKNGVQFFFEQCPTLKSSVKVACIGSATNTELLKKGVKADFIGDSSDTATISEDFKKIVGNDRVLFPQSDISMRTAQKHLNDSQVENLIVYRTTEATNVSIPENIDIVVFTSPSNVRSYFHMNQTKENPKYIAIGQSTGNELKKSGINDYLLPWDSSLLALADTIMSL